jgi:hypothetical protein
MNETTQAHGPDCIVCNRDDRTLSPPNGWRSIPEVYDAPDAHTVSVYHEPPERVRRGSSTPSPEVAL